MNTEHQDYDPIAVWQSQGEHAVPTLEEVMSKARQFDAKSRTGLYVFWTALSLHIALSVTEDFAGIKGRIWWVGVIRFALFMAWVVYLPFQEERAYGSLVSLRIATTTPVLDFYRRQLERRRDYFQDDYRRKFQIVALAIGFTLYSIFYPHLFLVFGIPIAFWAARLYRRMSGELPQIRGELQALDRLRSANSLMADDAFR